MKTGSLVLFSLFLAAALRAVDEPKLSALPIPVSNNAVAVLRQGRETRVFSFMGMGPKKTWNDVSNRAFALDLNSGKWTEGRPVPGVAGRLGASAVALREQVFLAGGYVIDGQGGERTLSDVNVFVPADNRWYRGEDVPVAVDDSVVGAYRDRFLYLIGGRSNAGAVRNVQVYDAEKGKWEQATPIPGIPVFGHAGALVGDTIVYVDGAYTNPDASRLNYLASNECWIGKINKGDVTKIEWAKLPAHPGNAHYRIAAGASEKQGKIYFSGGTENPYNYNGIGYNGQPSEPSPVTFAFNLKTAKWETINENTPDPTMDHRGLAVVSHGLVIVGGMEKGQVVTARVKIVKPASAK